MSEIEPCPDCHQSGVELPNGEMACTNDEDCSVLDYQNGEVLDRASR